MPYLQGKGRAGSSYEGGEVNKEKLPHARRWYIDRDFPEIKATSREYGHGEILFSAQVDRKDLRPVVAEHNNDIDRLCAELAEVVAERDRYRKALDLALDALTNHDWYIEQSESVHFKESEKQDMRTAIEAIDAALEQSNEVRG